jgi:hypothetical protein
LPEEALQAEAGLTGIILRMKRFARIGVVLGLGLALAGGERAMAERAGVKAYGAVINLGSGQVTLLPGDTSRALQSTPAVIVGDREYEARALRSSRSATNGGDRPGLVTVEERDAHTHALKRDWRPIQHHGFYDDCKLELHVEGQQLTVKAHFLTYM